MNKKINIIVIIFIFILILTVIGYNPTIKLINSTFQNIPNPDKMYIFKDGIQTEVNKESPFYSKILDSINSRLGSEISGVKDIVDNNVVNDLKNNLLGLEFIYENEQRFFYIGNRSESFNYYKLYFPLEIKEKESIIYYMQYGNKEHYLSGSRGPLSEPNEVIELIKEYLSKDNFE